jgi:SpoVK/Ycf46/Vps4 family AAA+-type ATPase
MADMIQLFEAARRVSVPILMIRTFDAAATIEAVQKVSAEHPLVQWDQARGMTGVNKLGHDALTKAKITSDDTVGFTEAMNKADGLPMRTILFAHNAHRQLTASEPISIAANVQSVANLRDRFKLNFRMLVLLGPQFTAPPELEHDIIIIDHALPGPEELGTIVTELYASAKLPKPTPEVLAKAVDAVSGLSSFETEQVTAMSLTDKGLDQNALWERKRVSIEQVRGMSVYRGSETFADLRGIDSAKAKLRARIKAKSPLGVVVWVDEGSDVFSNVEHDTSGVKTDQQRALLVEMENNNWKGCIFTGVPGSGKSALARSFGNEAGVPCVALDFGDMEAPHVGESEALLRQAIATIKAIGRGNAFFILTCNSLQGIRPQFMRRFKKGVFFFDMPTADERAAIWDLYLKKYEIPKQPKPDDEGWTGAEIRECCEEAWDVNCTLREAAQSIIPVSLSRADIIEEMRRNAHGRFLDASKAGTYKYESEPMKKQMRAISLPPVSPETLMRDLTSIGKES